MEACCGRRVETDDGDAEIGDEEGTGVVSVGESPIVFERDASKLPGRFRQQCRAWGRARARRRELAHGPADGRADRAADEVPVRFAHGHAPTPR